MQHVQNKKNLNNVHQPEPHVLPSSCVYMHFLGRETFSGFERLTKLCCRDPGSCAGASVNPQLRCENLLTGHRLQAVNLGFMKVLAVRVSLSKGTMRNLNFQFVTRPCRGHRKHGETFWLPFKMQNANCGEMAQHPVSMVKRGGGRFMVWDSCFSLAGIGKLVS